MTSRYLGYCTNVHAGSDLETTKSSLLEHAAEIQKRVCPNSRLGIGVWLSSAALSAIQKRGQAEHFSHWLERHSLAAYTLNGFPWGNFHDTVVKHAVYEPDWTDPRRLRYTLELIDLLDTLLPKGHYGSISTLPIAWGTPGPTETQLVAAVRALAQVCQRLERLEQQTGRWICLGLEPEPGCFLQRCSDVVQFFDRFFPSATARRYLGVCHDVCHTSVMFESQAEVLSAYREAGIRVVKVQVSSSVRLALSKTTSAADRAAAIAQLATFAEDRYLHQTCVSIDDGKPRFFEDLPLALQTIDAGQQSQEWRVHFHLPIYLESLGQLHTGQRDIRQCLRELDLEDQTIHLEVETYAWNVLPDRLQPDNLNEGIAKELQWLQQEIRQRECNSD